MDEDLVWFKVFANIADFPCVIFLTHTMPIAPIYILLMPTMVTRAANEVKRKEETESILIILISETTNFQVPPWLLCSRQVDNPRRVEEELDQEMSAITCNILVVVIICLVFIKKLNRRFYAVFRFSFFLWKWKAEKINIF